MKNTNLFCANSNIIKGFEVIQRRHGRRSAIRLVRGHRQDVFRSTKGKTYYIQKIRLTAA